MTKIGAIAARMGLLTQGRLIYGIFMPCRLQRVCGAAQTPEMLSYIQW